MAAAPAATGWGPLEEPIHPEAAGPDDPTWKDNAYLSFWDLPGQIFGTLHVSTSPNAPAARRARCSMSVEGRTVEVVETLPAGEFTSESIRFGLDGTIEVDHPECKLDVVARPVLSPSDSSVSDAMPALVPGRPLIHHEQAGTVTGSVVLGTGADAVRREVRATAMRDRTWGFRDESSQFVEYIGVVGVFDDRFLSVVKFLGADGSMVTGGCVVDGSGTTPVQDMHVTRDAAALFVSARLDFADGSTSTVTAPERVGGFWVPMGVGREGPALGAYDDFLRMDLDGADGGGFVEQATMHRAF